MTTSLRRGMHVEDFARGARGGVVTVRVVFFGTDE